MSSAGWPGTRRRGTPTSVTAAGAALAGAPALPGPAEPGEVQDAAAGVDRRAAVHRDQAHPGRPLTPPELADRLAPAGLDRRVGVEKDQQVATRGARAEVGAGRKAEISAARPSGAPPGTAAAARRARPSADPLSTTITSSAGASSLMSGGNVPRRSSSELWATTMTERLGVIPAATGPRSRRAPSIGRCRLRSGGVGGGVVGVSGRVGRCSGGGFRGVCNFSDVRPLMEGRP